MKSLIIIIKGILQRSPSRGPFQDLVCSIPLVNVLSGWVNGEKEKAKYKILIILNSFHKNIFKKSIGTHRYSILKYIKFKIPPGFRKCRRALQPYWWPSHFPACSTSTNPPTVICILEIILLFTTKYLVPIFMWQNKCIILWWIYNITFFFSHPINTCTFASL